MQAYRDLVFGQWWTDATGRTGADGAYATRGFLGEYTVRVTQGGKTQTQSFTLDPKGAQVLIALGQ